MLLRLATAAFLLLAACGGERAAVRRPAADSAGSAGLPTRDDRGTPIRAATPARIVSLNPTTTEILFALGAGSRVVGRTHWDLWPDSARQVPDLGNGMQPNVETVLGARPDLVILYASGENDAAATRLRSLGITVYAFRADRIADFRRVTLALGTVVGEPARAATVVDSVRRTLDRVKAATSALPRPRVVLPMFDNPLYVIGGGSYLSELIAVAGGRNVYDSLSAPSPQVSLEDVLRRDPDVVLASPEAVRRILGDPRWSTLAAVRARRVLPLDSSVVLGPGPRLGEAAVEIARLLHPGAVR